MVREAFVAQAQARERFIANWVALGHSRTELNSAQLDLPYPLTASEIPVGIVPLLDALAQIAFTIYAPPCVKRNVGEKAAKLYRKIKAIFDALK